MNIKVTYLDNGSVMEADPAELARWYMDCYRRGDFWIAPPGEHAAASLIDFELPLDEYDDPGYFLEELISHCEEQERKVLKKEVAAFMKE